MLKAGENILMIKSSNENLEKNNLEQENKLEENKLEENKNNENISSSEEIVLKIDNFEGPLELLLYLIDKKKLKISEVRIAQLIDEYLAILDNSKKDNIEIKVEFVLIATELLEIKAMSVLNLNKEVQSEKMLKQRLEDYKLLKEVSEEISNMGSEFNIAYSRKDGRKIRKVASSEYDLSKLRIEDIYESYKKYLKVVDEEIIEIKYEKKYSIQEEIEKIQVIVFENPMSIDEVFGRAENKTHLVYIFLAILDIYKEGKVDIKKTEDTIYIENIKSVVV